MWLVDLNYNLECDWLIEVSDYKLSDNNQLITIEEIVIVMIKNFIRLIN